MHLYVWECMHVCAGLYDCVSNHRLFEFSFYIYVAVNFIEIYVIKKLLKFINGPVTRL